MESIALDPAFAPKFSAYALGYIALGITLGTCSGLIPGIHANNFALFLAGIAPMLPGQPIFVGLAMLAAGVTHTFLDAVPALTIGVPEAAMAVAALPGHRMVLEGRGHEALRLSALGSGIAVLLAIPLAIPITWGMVRIYPFLREHMPIILGTVVLVLLLTERTRQAVIGGVISFLVSSILGFLVLDLEPAAPLDGGGVLAPLFAGLFGTPVLVDAMRGGGVPPQSGGAIRIPRRAVLWPASAGSAAGAIVGYLPGVSSAIAAVIALVAIPNEDPDRDFIVATSGVDTANTIFALFALVAIGAPRTGIMVAVEQADVPISLPAMLLSIAIAAAISFILVILIGDWYLVTVGSVNYTIICGVVMGLLTVLAFLFAGVIGIIVFAVSSAIGFIPVRIGGKRVHLMCTGNVLVRVNERSLGRFKTSQGHRSAWSETSPHVPSL